MTPGTGNILKGRASLDYVMGLFLGTLLLFLGTLLLLLGTVLLFLGTMSVFWET